MVWGVGSKRVLEFGGSATRSAKFFNAFVTFCFWIRSVLKKVEFTIKCISISSAFSMNEPIYSQCSNKANVNLSDTRVTYLLFGLVSNDLLTWSATSRASYIMLLVTWKDFAITQYLELIISSIVKHGFYTFGNRAIIINKRSWLIRADKR